MSRDRHRPDARGVFNAYAMVSSLALAVLLFYVGHSFSAVERGVRSSGYLGTFLLGILYVYSFTSLPATALLAIIGRTQNLWVAGSIATGGAVVGDMVLFQMFRLARRVRHDHEPHLAPYERWWATIEGKLPRVWRPVALMTLVSVVLVLPLPNEFADFLLAKMRVTTRTMFLISYVGNGIGLFAIMWVARL